MIRILHLLPHDADFEIRRLSHALATRLGEGFEIHAQAAGSVAGAMLTVRRRLRRQGPFDLLHVWGNRLLPAAALAGRTPLIHTPSAAIRNNTIRWLRAIAPMRNVHVACPTATGRRHLIEHGAAIDRCHLLRPGVDFSRVRRRRDPALRAALGFDDDDFVLLAPGESTREAAHEQAAWAISILHVVDPSYKLLLWGRGPATPRALAMGRHMRQPGLVRSAQGRLGRAVELEDLLPAADAIVIPARGPVSTLPIAVSMAAGLPIISTVTYSAAELLEDRHNALMAPPAKPRLLAQRILDARADSQLQWTISDAARTEAYEHFSVSRFVDQHRTLYRQVQAGEAIDVQPADRRQAVRIHG